MPLGGAAMKLTLTAKQLEDLMKLVTLGNWVTNSWRGEERLDEFDEVESLVLAAAEGEGLKAFVERGEEGRGSCPSVKLEEATQPYLDFYDDNTFWDQLVYRLADRDYLRRYGEEAEAELDTEPGKRKEAPLIAKYEKEFDAFGLDRVEIHRDH
jgi:hypothetical protein